MHGRRTRLQFEPLEQRRTLSASTGDLSQPAPAVASAPAAQYAVKHAPRLQPGNAPLAGYPGGELDRVDVLWQTVPAGAGTSDSFVVDVRPAGGDDWQSAALNAAIDTGVDGRLVHSASLTGLAWDAAYEYRVRQLRGADVLATYQHGFRTRLAAGDTDAFSFVAYGDSASGSAAGFRSVQSRINQLDPAFAVLLGDNVYSVGSHAESDARFDPQVNPEAAAWMASHVDWLGMGNHDVATAAGLPTEQNYSVPIPVAGVTAPAAPPAGERPEHSFSWDYGSVHFVTFDTNALGSSARLDGLLDWVEADLAASTARWKIVYGHHPLAGVPDKPESPGDNYYQQVVNRLKAAGVDLFMTGHSHTYSWTYPLTGEVGGVATYEDHGADDHFPAGVGLTQLVSGVGGVEIRSGDYSRFPFVAEGFSRSTATAARLGFSKIDVTPERLTVSYVAADDGSVIDSFRIEKETVQAVSFRQGVDGYAGTVDTMLHEDAPTTSFAAAGSLKVDADNPTNSGRRVQALLRFADLFGAGPGRIPADAVLRSATLRLQVTNGGDSLALHRMATDWAAAATWASVGGGIQADGIEAVAFADTSTGRSDVGTFSFNVLASLRAWQASPAANLGWAIVPTGADGVDFHSAEGAAPPELLVTYVVSGSSPAAAAKFFVADAAARASFGYDAAGVPLGARGYAAANDGPRGVAASPDGSRLWVVDAAGTVFVYDAAMRLQGSWRATGLVTPTGIAVAGTSIAVVDQGTRRIHVFDTAVARLTGEQAATRSFSLASGNRNPQDLATDGRTAWVVNAAAGDKVFVYGMSNGSLLGSWRLDGRNGSPTGITIDPTAARRSVWVVDDAADRVFEYRDGRTFRSGNRRAAAFFALAAGNGSPQGIADPPAPAGSAAAPAGQVPPEPAPSTPLFRWRDGDHGQREVVLQRRLVGERVPMDQSADHLVPGHDHRQRTGQIPVDRGIVPPGEGLQGGGRVSLRRVRLRLVDVVEGIPHLPFDEGR